MRVLVAVAAAVLLAAGLTALPAPTAHAAAPTVLVHRLDPLMTDPVRLEVDVVDDAGLPLAFSGTIALSVGRTRSSVTAAGTGSTIVSLPTSTLSGGSATLTARLKAAGSTRATVLKDFLQVAPGLQVAGFGCTQATAKGATLRWAVTWLNGDPIIAPATRDRVPRLPYIATTGGLAIMSDAAGAPLTTSGSMTIRSGTRTVATVKVASTVRRLLFGVRWKGGAPTGAYTATLALKDTAGRVTTATQPVSVVAKASAICR